MHARGFEPPKPQGATVLRTAAANRICLTCTNWRKRSESNAHIPKDGPLRTGSARHMPSASKQTRGEYSIRTNDTHRVLRVSSAAPSTTRPTLREKNLVRMKGFEPLRHLRHMVLSHACLPFHHIRVVPEEGFEPSRSLSTATSTLRVSHSTIRD